LLHTSSSEADTIGLLIASGIIDSVPPHPKNAKGRQCKYDMKIVNNAR
jgi:hypothetical protein